MGHNRPDRPSLVEQHSPGLLADQKKKLPVGGDPLSAVTEAPSVDLLSLTPRPALAAATERARVLREKVALPDPSYRQQQQQQPK